VVPYQTAYEAAGLAKAAHVERMLLDTLRALENVEPDGDGVDEDGGSAAAAPTQAAAAGGKLVVFAHHRRVLDALQVTFRSRGRLYMCRVATPTAMHLWPQRCPSCGRRACTARGSPSCASTAPWRPASARSPSAASGARARCAWRSCPSPPRRLAST